MKFTSVTRNSELKNSVNNLGAETMSGAIECNRLQESQMISVNIKFERLGHGK